MPKIDVLIPVRNGAPFLGATFDSLAAQTLRDFRLLICDDGSTDETPTLIEREHRFPVVILRHGTPQGVAASLNDLLDLSTATAPDTAPPYIARLDADDLCRFDRFARQVAFLEAHPDVGIVGSWMEEIDSAGNVIGERQYPIDDGELRLEMLFRDPLPHPALMLRADLFRNPTHRYDPRFESGEDFELWTRLSAHTRFANLPTKLTFYRRHKNAVGVAHRGKQMQIIDDIRRKVVETLPLDPESRGILVQLLGLCSAPVVVTLTASLRLLRGIDRLYPPFAPSASLRQRRSELALGLLRRLSRPDRIRLLAADAGTRRAYAGEKLRQFTANWQRRSCATAVAAARRHGARRLRNSVNLQGGHCEPDLRVYGDGSAAHRVQFGRETILEHGCSLWISPTEHGGRGRLVAGDFLFLGFNTRINIFADIVIGRQVLIGANTYITSSIHNHASREVPIQCQGFSGAPVNIGDGVWIGCNVVVLAGVTIGRGAIIGAGSVVIRDVPEFEVWGGVPARRLKDRPA